jgi:hypothetical protein
VKTINLGLGSTLSELSVIDFVHKQGTILAGHDHCAVTRVSAGDQQTLCCSMILIDSYKHRGTVNALL